MKRCQWSRIGVPPCGKEATHAVTLAIDGEMFYLCRTHAGTARKEGWRGVNRLEPRR